jgi:hypothetical protein
MPRVPRIALLALVSFCGVGIGTVAAQQFGRNKVEYVDFDFKIFDTEHFSVYHYSGEEESARIVARLAERWYVRLSSQNLRRPTSSTVSSMRVSAV